MSSIRNLTLSFFILVLTSPAAFAYMSITESTEIVPENTHQFGLEPQFFMGGASGVNFNAFLDSGVNESSSYRVGLSAGTIDFTASASYKWIPIPDFENQPAIGGKFSLSYAHDSDLNFLTFQAAPMFGKKFWHEKGTFFSYLAVPISFISTKDRSYVGTQFTVGSEFIANDNNQIKYGAEFGMNLSDSYSYLSAFIVLPFDRSSGVHYRKR